MRQAIERYLKRTGFERFTPKAVLFDMDGVLYDSMPNHAKAWHQCMESRELEMSENDAYLYEGMRGVETIRLIAERQWHRNVSDEEAAEIYRQKSAIYSAFPPAPMIDGIHDLQEAIRQQGWKIGVVTGSGQTSLLNRILQDFEGLVFPDILVSAKDVSRGKPCPDPYIKGMEKAGAQPWETMVVENAPLGVKAAVAARCLTVAVNTGPLPDSVLADAGADLILPSMTALKTLITGMEIPPSDGE